MPFIPGVILRKILDCTCGPMASAEREPITGVWGRSPQRGSTGQSPRWEVRWEGRSPPEDESFLVFRLPMEATKLPFPLHFANSVNHRHLRCVSPPGTLLLHFSSAEQTFSVVLSFTYHSPTVCPRS